MTISYYTGAETFLMGKIETLRTNNQDIRIFVIFLFIEMLVLKSIYVYKFWSHGNSVHSSRLLQIWSVTLTLGLKSSIQWFLDWYINNIITIESQFILYDYFTLHWSWNFFDGRNRYLHNKQSGYQDFWNFIFVYWNVSLEINLCL